MTDASNRSHSDLRSLDPQLVSALRQARQDLGRGPTAGEDALIRLQVAHSLSLALADGVAQIRRLQTLALASQAAAQQRLLDGGDAETAREVVDIGRQSVTDATEDTLSLAQAVIDLVGRSPSDPDHGPSHEPDA